MNYQKYIKYKKKYLNLKNKLGGSSVAASSEYFMPSEINNFTKRLFLSNQEDRNKIEEHLKLEFKKITDSDSIEIVRVNRQFAQDGYIFLKNRAETINTYAIGKFHNRKAYEQTDISDITYSFNNFDDADANHYGGNFISSPEPNVVFTFDNSKFTDSLKSKLEVISLECSFKSDGIRHIDETMCFMPYGKNMYKVWIYSPIFKSDDLEIDEKEKKELFEFWESFKAKQEFTGLTNDSIINEHWFSKENNIFWHPKYKKIVLSSLTDQNIELIKKNILEEHQRNLDNISNKLFMCNYNDCSDNFVLFDLEIKIDFNIRDKQFEFKINEIPIFNRLLVETSSIKHIVFPKVSEKTKLSVEEQKRFIKSYIDNKEFTFSELDTTEFNNEGSSYSSTGGNLHCLVKNQY